MIAPQGAELFWDCLCIAGVFCSQASCDNWNFDSSNPCLYVGGNYNQNANYGMFYVNYYMDSDAIDNIGCRLQELPNN